MEAAERPPIRVLIADDDPAMRAALSDMLDRLPGIRLVGAAVDAAEAVALASELRPDVALLDVRMPKGGGPTAAAEIAQLSAGTAVVALSAAQDQQSVMAMMDAGARGYLVKGVPNREIEAMIREASETGPEPAPPSTAAGGPLRVLVADDDPAIRDVLVDVLEADPEIEVVGAASNALQAVTLAHLHRPDVALLDVRMPGGGGAHAARGIRAELPSTRVVALSATTGRETVREMLEAGATSYLVKGARNEQIVSAVRDAAEGKSIVSTEVAGTLLEELVLELGRSPRDEGRLRAEKRARILSVIDSGGPDMVFQPVFDLGTRSIVGFEALSRFPARSTRTPSVWFSDAEEVGLTVRLEVAAISAALDVSHRLPHGAWLALNLSPETLSSAELAEAMTLAGDRRIVLEMTEHKPVADYDYLVLALAELRRRHGVRIAVDDAGAGFASLRHILMLDPEFIKLDISLTRGVAQDARRRALAGALAAFGRDIGATVIAEGVETQVDLDALAALEVPCGQGFHLGRPGRPDAVAPRLPA